MKKYSKILVGLVVAVILLAESIVYAMPVQAAAKPQLNVTNISMDKGQSRTLKLSGSGKVTWSSSKKSVVSVNKNGKIKALKKGTATITAERSGKKYRCNVVVHTPSKKKQDVLIVYFSQTGTTKDVAEKIQKLTKGDLLRIQEKKAYPKDYERTVERASRELEKKSKPEITTVAANIKSYDVVYVGFPIWWHSTPRVINTFLEKYKLEGKTVIPFCTSGGSDIEEAMPEIEKLCSGNEILEGYTADSGSSKEIRKWLKGIGQL